MPEQQLFEIKANLFKGLAHPLRIRVLEILAAAPDGDTGVAALLTGTGLEASHLSQHLAVLRTNHLVTAERRGSLVFYRLAHPQVADLLAVAKQLLRAILEETRDHLETESAGDALVAAPAVADRS